jgi:hypothetical protein
MKNRCTSVRAAVVLLALLVVGACIAMKRRKVASRGTLNSRPAGSNEQLNDLVGTSSSSSVHSVGSLGSARSIGSIGSFWSIGSIGSSFSIGSIGSSFSIGSIGSFCSIASIASAASIGSFASAGARFSVRGNGHSNSKE